MTDVISISDMTFRKLADGPIGKLQIVTEKMKRISPLFVPYETASSCPVTKIPKPCKWQGSGWLGL